MPPANKYVYDFGDGRADGNADMKDLLGGKGANLAEMAREGHPVPPGFTLTTEVHTAFEKGGYPQGLVEQVQDSLERVERRTGKIFGDLENPLFVSVRSGATESLPGMMDTILSVGMNDDTVKTLAAQSGDPRRTYKSYCRFIETYTDLVLKADVVALEDARDAYMEANNISLLRPDDMKAEDWKAVAALYIDALQKAGTPFPQNPQDQLWGSIGAVFHSSMNDRAVKLRREMKITDARTGVTIQSMVFGDYGDNSASGVVYTRNPFDGADRLFGNYARNAPGTVVVDGQTEDHPHPQITKFGRRLAGSAAKSLEELMPKVYRELVRRCSMLETHGRYMQAVEFTVENGKLWLLQTRDGRCSPEAEQNFLVKMAEDGLITKDQAADRADVTSLPVLDRSATRETLGYGTPASSGAGTGQLVFSKEDAVRLKKQGIPVILCRVETDPDDVEGVIAAQGVITTKGGRMSHAACVARALRRPCLVSLKGAEIDLRAKTLTFADGRVVREGEVITVDGNGVEGKEAELILGNARKVKPEISPAGRKLIAWGDVRARRPDVNAGVEEAHRLQT